MPHNLTITKRRRRLLQAIHDGGVTKAHGMIIWNGRDISDEFTPLQAAGYAGIGSGESTSVRSARPVKLTDKGRTTIGVDDGE